VAALSLLRALLPVLAFHIFLAGFLLLLAEEEEEEVDEDDQEEDAAVAAINA
jgi:hypothetical protein